MILISDNPITNLKLWLNLFSRLLFALLFKPRNIVPCRITNISKAVISKMV